MDWRLKRLLRQTARALPGGERLYRWLTVNVLGTQAGMAAKWFRVMPAHIKVLAEQFGDEARGQALWCLDSGASIAAGLANALISDQPGLLTDRLDRLTDRYNDAALSVARSAGGALAELSKAPGDRLGRVLAGAASGTARERLAALDMAYSADHALAASDAWRGRLGCIYSAGTLEHYRPAELEALVTTMAAALRLGGVLSHVVDHRDHRWHADKTVPPLAHLGLDDAAYEAAYGNALDYHNRWLRSDWTALFERHGLTVTSRTVIGYEADLPPLDRASLQPAWRERGDEDLGSVVTHFVAVRR